MSPGADVGTTTAGPLAVGLEVGGLGTGLATRDVDAPGRVSAVVLGGPLGIVTATGPGAGSDGARPSHPPIATAATATVMSGRRMVRFTAAGRRS
jgi:hypothetical protein